MLSNMILFVFVMMTLSEIGYLLDFNAAIQKR